MRCARASTLAVMYLPIVIVVWHKTGSNTCSDCNNADCHCLYNIRHIQTDFRLHCHDHYDFLPSCSRCRALRAADHCVSRWGGITELVCVAFAFEDPAAGTHCTFSLSQKTTLSYGAIDSGTMQEALMILKNEVVTAVNTHVNGHCTSHDKTHCNHSVAREYMTCSTMPCISGDRIRRYMQQVGVGRQWKALARHQDIVLGDHTAAPEQDSVDGLFLVEGGTMAMERGRLSVTLPVHCVLEFLDAVTRRSISTELYLHTKETDENTYCVSSPYRVVIGLPSKCSSIASDIRFCCHDLTQYKITHPDNLHVRVSVHTHSNNIATPSDARLQQLHHTHTDTSGTGEALQNVGWPEYVHRVFLNIKYPHLLSKSVTEFQPYLHTVFSAPEVARLSNTIGLQLLSCVLFVFRDAAVRGLADIVLKQNLLQQQALDHLFALQLSMVPDFTMLYHHAVDLLLQIGHGTATPATFDLARALNAAVKSGCDVHGKPVLSDLRDEVRAFMFSEIVAEVASHIFHGRSSDTVALFGKNRDIWREITHIRNSYTRCTLGSDSILFIQGCQSHATRDVCMVAFADALREMHTFNDRMQAFLERGLSVAE